MIQTETRQGARRDICGARMKNPPPGHKHLVCGELPYHFPPTPNGPAVHIARDAGGIQLAVWQEGD